jgi:phosphoglycolate phosphatase
MTWPLVLFDLDGTLVDSFQDIRDGIVVACRAIGVAATDSLLALSTRGVPLEAVYITAVGQLDHGFDRFADAYRGFYNDAGGCLATTRAYDGIVEVLSALRGRAKIGVATTKRTANARRVLEGTGLLPLVDGFSGSDGLAHKPAPDVLVKVARELGVPVERAVMIGDTDRDLGAARAAKCDEIAVTWGGFSEEELAAHSPRNLARRPEDLLTLLA